MSANGSTRLLRVVVVWLVVFGLAALAYRGILHPWLTRRDQTNTNLVQYNELRQQAEARGIDPGPTPQKGASPQAIAALTDALKNRLTSSRPLDPNAKDRLSLALDSFSGYCIFRSDEFHNDLAARGVSLALVDDGADYAARMKSLADGRTPLAVFTVDALIKASADLGQMPATTVMVIDETTGADAMVAYKDAVPNINALNDSSMRIVTTRQSPSETLARVVMASFRLPDLPADAWVDANGAADVYEKFRTADRNQRRAYVLWEPFVAKALEIDGAHVLIDSSRFRGYIVDVLVAQRQYLLEHEDAVQQVVEAYLRTLYERRRQPDGLVRLVTDDAAKSGQELTEKQAEALVNGIWFKSTQDNYAHMGMLSGAAAQGVQDLAEIHRNITAVLLRTGAMKQDPTNGRPNMLFYDGILRRLQANQFHPALVRPADAGSSADPDALRAAVALPPLTEAQWAALVPVGTLQVERIVFARGTATLTEPSKLALGRLAQTLRSWPQYYLHVQGHARPEGDADANRQLAEARAAAAARFIVEQGIEPHRVRAVSMEPTKTGGEAQTVTFVLGQTPY